MTEFQIKALKAIQSLGVATPRRFAETIWPDHPGWKKLSNIGRHGATRGVGMWRAGGAYLGKLQKLGLVRYSFLYHGYKLTGEGEKTLADITGASLQGRVKP